MTNLKFSELKGLPERKKMYKKLNFENKQIKELCCKYNRFIHFTNFL